MTPQSVDEFAGASVPQFDLAVVTSSHNYVVARVEGQRKDVAFVALEVLSQAEELFLVGLPIPLDDGLVFGAGVDVGGRQLEGRDAQRVTLVL